MNDRSREGKGRIWVGWGISALVVLFLLMDAVMKFVKPAPVVAVCTKLGLPLEVITPIGVLLLVCTVLYAAPRTALLGAVLLTGYLGGAVSIHVRAGDPLFSHVLFPVYLGGLAWLGLYLRDVRVRSLLA
ncbi:MAG: DoxX family protein [Acidobacteriota bacterium]|nr:DoxX family protein [Acidobacteriota bacterium]